MFGPRATLKSPIRLLGATPQSIPRVNSPRPWRHVTTVAYPNTPPSKSSIWLRRLIYTGIFGSLGMAVGKRIEEKVTAPPVPGSELDTLLMTELQHIYEKATPIVMKLRNDPDYEEQGVYGNYTEDESPHRLTSGPLRGGRGLAMQSVFWNAKEKEAISVVFLGEGLEGWPTIVHGGALGTVIDENLGRVALRSLPERTGVTANLQVNYRAPVYSGHFYTFHSKLDQEKSSDRKAHVKGEVRDPLGGLCVEASGLFVVPKTYKLKRLGEEY